MKLSEIEGIRDGVKVRRAAWVTTAYIYYDFPNFYLKEGELYIVDVREVAKDDWELYEAPKAVQPPTLKQNVENNDRFEADKMKFLELVNWKYGEAPRFGDSDLSWFMEDKGFVWYVYDVFGKICFNNELLRWQNQYGLSNNYHESMSPSKLVGVVVMKQSYFE